MRPSTVRARAALVAAVLIPIGVGTKLYSGPGATWVADNLGGSVYVMFWSFAALAFEPAWKPARVAAVVLGCTCGIEILQLWHPPFLEVLRATVLGQAVLGGVFQWSDLPFYALGAVAAVGLARPVLAPAARAGMAP